MRRFLYRIYLMITATSIVNIALIFVRLRFALNDQLVSLDEELTAISERQKEAMKNPKQTKGNQIDQIRKRSTVRVAVIGNKAYWVYENTFYEGDVINGFIDNTAAVPVDAHKLSDKELSVLMEVLDNISK